MLLIDKCPCSSESQHLHLVNLLSLQRPLVWILQFTGWSLIKWKSVSYENIRNEKFIDVVLQSVEMISLVAFLFWLADLKFSLKNKGAETVMEKQGEEGQSPDWDLNEVVDSGGNRLQVCFPPLLMLICACPSFLCCSMLNWLNVVCVDFYTADVPVSEAMIPSAGVHFISINFHFFLKICFLVCLLSNQVSLFDFYNMTYPQRPWLWVSLFSMTLENRETMNHILGLHSYCTVFFIIITFFFLAAAEADESPVMTWCLQHWATLSPLLISQSRHPEHHFCTVCFRILHKYDHKITDVYKNTLSHVQISVCLHNHFWVIKVHVQQIFWEETTSLKVTASLTHTGIQSKRLSSGGCWELRYRNVFLSQASRNQGEPQTWQKLLSDSSTDEKSTASQSDD